MDSEPNILPFKQELKVIAVLIVFLCALELTARYLAPHLDYDRMHISKFESIVAAVPEQDQQLSVVGNSLLMHGFEPEIFNKKLPDVQITKITPVGTAIQDWDMIFKRYFEGSGTIPKQLLIGFVAHHINDSEPVKLRRMARHFSTMGDLPYLWENEHLDFHQKAQSVLSVHSALIGDQPEHRLRSLEFLIPQYRKGLNLNKDFANNKSITRTDGAPKKPTFNRLTRFLVNCKKHNIQVYLVPMPQPEVWEMDPEINKIAKQFNATILDARQISGMGEKDFSDGYHLGETGIVKFSNWLADEFVKRSVYP